MANLPGLVTSVTRPKASTVEAVCASDPQLGAL